MEKIFEKILHGMRSRISLATFVFSFTVSIVNPKGVFQLIFEFVFQYTQNKIFSFSFSFFFIFLFFYAIFNKVFLWFGAKKYEQDLIDQKDKEIALKIYKCHYKIQKELYKCYSEKQNKIPRTDEFDYLIGCLGLRDFLNQQKTITLSNRMF